MWILPAWAICREEFNIGIPQGFAISVVTSGILRLPLDSNLRQVFGGGVWGTLWEPVAGWREFMRTIPFLQWKEDFRTSGLGVTFML